MKPPHRAQPARTSGPSDPLRVTNIRGASVWILPPLLCAVLAVTSLSGDSVTFDETSHITSGLSYWVTGDFRLAPEHPPLAKLWCTVPLLVMNHGFHADLPGWESGDFWTVGRTWLSRAPHRESLVAAARCMMVVVLLGCLWSIHRLSRRLFGPVGGRIALIAACLSPTILAHGRLVTTDLPAALLFLLTLEAYSRIGSSSVAPKFGPGHSFPGWRWWTMPLSTFPAAIALGALSLTKFSWPAVLPALLGSWLLRTCRIGVSKNNEDPTTQERNSARHPSKSRTSAESGSRSPSDRRWVRLAVVVMSSVVVPWMMIWTCFGFRFSPYARAVATAGGEAGFPGREGSAGDQGTDPSSWEWVLGDSSGAVTQSPLRWTVDQALRRRLLPEAYLYGLAYTFWSTERRPAYLMGEVSEKGWWSYFPIAFTIKTPIPVLVLAVLSAAGMVRDRFSRRRRNRVDPLFATLIAFALVYGWFAVGVGLNIGHRHLLPLYPVMFVLIGGTGYWWSRPWGRRTIVACLSWLLLETLWVHPHYLGYFNPLIGGPKNGYRYLADSNLDWGQDLKRLARFATIKKPGPVKLAYFGSVDPASYGFDAKMLPSSFPFSEPADLTAGCYVVSVTQLLGVYLPEARPAYWSDQTHRRQWSELSGRVLQAGGSDAQSADVFRFLRQARLLSRLRDRTPDDRIGTSLFVYRLDESDVEQMTLPEEVPVPDGNPDSNR